MKFYDTCALLHLQGKIFSEPFAISSVTIQELDNIKESRVKDPHIKYTAKNMSRMLRSHVGEYQVVRYVESMMPHGIDETPDNMIIACANSLDNVTFITEDVNCYLMAINVFGLSAEFIVDKKDDYTGFFELDLNDDELADFYSNPHLNKWNIP